MSRNDYIEVTKNGHTFGHQINTFSGPTNKQKINVRYQHKVAKNNGTPYIFYSERTP